MEKVKQTIIDNKLIVRGEIIGVAVSGGEDSMALLHCLNSLQDELDFEVVAIHIDHSIRENSGDDARFVMDYCKKNCIRAYKFKVDAVKISKDKNISIESAAREARYGIFDAVLTKGIVDKIAIAHHMSDQAETVLMRLFRGSGVSGAKGMDFVRDEVYIRPMLTTLKKEITSYINQYDIPYVQDETNYDDSYSRNFLRNKVIPMIQKNWPNVIENIVDFSNSCKDDDAYINTQVYDDALIISGKTVRIPCSYFLFSNAIVSRLLFKALKKIGVEKDIERTHINMIMSLASSKDNGKKISLPFGITAHKEYDYVTIVNKYIPKPTGKWAFRSGEFTVPNFGTVVSKRTKDLTHIDGTLLFDHKKIPKDAIWRFREDGDMFEKFGSGTKKLKSFLIDKKIPLRLRDNIPVLAYENEVYVIAGVEISEKVRVDDTAQTAYRVKVLK